MKKSISLLVKRALISYKIYLRLLNSFCKINNGNCYFSNREGLSIKLKRQNTSVHK